MITNRFFVFLIVIIVLSSCKKESPNPLQQTLVLLFKSGFEGDVYIDNTAYEDNETGFSWPINILGQAEVPYII